jgi:hypothetical protein
MSLTQLQQDLLKRIEGGQTNFSPDGEYVTPEQFQAVADALIDLRDSGYIEMGEPHVNTSTAVSYIDLIFNCHLVD